MAVDHSSKKKLVLYPIGAIPGAVKVIFTSVTDHVAHWLNTFPSHLGQGIRRPSRRRAFICHRSTLICLFTYGLN